MGDPKHSDAHGFVSHMPIEGDGIFPVVGNAGALHLGLEVSLAISGTFGSSMKTILRHAGAIDVLIKKPIHLVIAVEIHGARHVFFHYALEVFCRGRLVIKVLQ